jgi:hypothetical protein
MAPSSPTRVLVVANRTAATPELLEEIGRRARARPCVFFLPIPSVEEPKNPDWTLESALRLLEREAHAPVEGLLAEPDALAAIERAVDEREIDEIILSTVPTHLAHWLRRDLAQRVEELGLPVTVIAPEQERPMRWREFLERVPPAASLPGGPGSVG